MKNMQIAQRAIPEKPLISGKSSKRKYNLSTYFLTPIVSKSIYTKNQQFINSYLYYDDLENINNLYILTKTEFIEVYSNYISHIKVKDDNFLYTFDISKFKDDVKLFTEGKYSKFSQELKDIICPVNIKNIMLTDIYKILYKTQDRKEFIEEMIGQKLHSDAEVCSIINKEDETYK